MAEIAILPFDDASVQRRWLGNGGYAEGSHAWFRTLAATTLEPGEIAEVAIAGDAMLPIVRTSCGTRALTAPYTTRYVPPLGDAASAHALGRAARTYAAGTLRLDAIDTAVPGMDAFLGGLAQSSLAVAHYEGFANWHETVGDFASYWRARPSRLRATVRRKLAATADATFECRSRDWERLLTAYEDVYAASWKEPEPHRTFIPEMVRLLTQDGLVRIGVMSLAGRAVAAQIWLVCAGRGTIFKLAHRQDAAEHSPGTLLTYRMVEALIDEGAVTEIDFGRGDDAYKRDWTRNRRTRLGIVAADWRTASGLAAFGRDIVPTRASGALRRHFGKIRIGSEGEP